MLFLRMILWRIILRFFQGNGNIMLDRGMKSHVQITENIQPG